MEKNGWRVSVLRELHPNQRTILGYNKNKGQEIALRLRTDDLQGFRLYSSIINVMLHELAHMIHSAHDESFHALNRQLNQEYKMHTSGQSVSNEKFYSSSQASLSLQQGQRLGGSTPTADLRTTMAKAAERRLSAQEQEALDGCGNLK